LELASDDVRGCSKSFEHASNDLEHRSNHFGDRSNYIDCFTKYFAPCSKYFDRCSNRVVFVAKQENRQSCGKNAPDADS
jgi:hypothetical protein